MTDAAFAEHVDAARVAVLEKPKTLYAQSNSMWGKFVCGTGSYLFDGKLRGARALRGLTRAYLLAFFDAHVGAGAPQRRKLVSHVYAAAHRPMPSLGPGGNAGGADDEDDVALAAALALAGEDGGAGSTGGGGAARIVVGPTAADQHAFRDARPLFAAPIPALDGLDCR